MLLVTMDLDGMGIILLKNDSSDNVVVTRDPGLFYDSLQMKANRHRVTKWMYDYMISSANDSVHKD